MVWIDLALTERDETTMTRTEICSRVKTGSGARSGSGTLTVLGALIAIIAWPDNPVFAADPDQLEEVVVTAQKREQSLQVVPISITAFSSDQIRALGMTQTMDIASQTPGVVLTGTTSGTVTILPTVRGVSQNDYSEHQEMPNAVYIDEAYVSAPGAIGFSLFDIERAEVLRGPQGTLFGRNATGGALQFVTAKPTKNDTGFVDAEYGSYVTRRVEGAIGGSVTDSIQGRFAFLVDNHGPWWENKAPPTVAGGNSDTFEKNTLAGRGQLNFEFSDSVQDLIGVTRAVDRHHAEGTYKSIPAAVGPQGLGYNIPPNSTANGTCPGCDDFGYRDPNLNTPFESSFNGVGFLSRQLTSFNNRLTWDLAPLSLTSVTNYQDFSFGYSEDTDATPYNVALYPQSVHLHQLSQEVRLNGSATNLNYTIGAYYLHIIQHDYQGYSTGLTADSPLAPFALSTLETFQQYTRSSAIFGQTEYEFTPTWTLTTGLRFSADRKEFQSITVDTPSQVVIAEFNTGNVGDQTIENKNDIGGKVELDWKPNHSVMLYAEVARGNKGPGFNGMPAGPLPVGYSVPFKAEALTDYEAGYKLGLFDGKVRLNGSFYFYNYQNYQAFNYVALSTIVSNKDAQLYGGEVELTAQPAPGWNVVFGLSGEKGTVYDVLLPNGQFTDRQPPIMPEVTANALVRKDWTVFGGLFGAQLDFRYTGRSYAAISNAPDTILPGTATFNSRLSFARGDHWEGALRVANIANRAVAVYAFDTAPYYGSSERSYAPPRWITIEANYHW